MKQNKVYVICPYLNASPKGAFCNAVNDLITNICDIDLSICEGKHFEVCHVYAATLKELVEIPLALKWSLISE